MSTRCTRCDFETDDTEGLTACPYCGSDRIPMDSTRDLTVRVNWHELRILVMWAMNWASRTEDPKKAEAAVAAIARRLAHQKPDPSWPGLTMGDDIRQLAEAVMDGTLTARSGKIEVISSHGDPRGKGEHVVWPGSWTLVDSESTGSEEGR